LVYLQAEERSGLAGGDELLQGGLLIASSGKGIPLSVHLARKKSEGRRGKGIFFSKREEVGLVNAT